MDVKDIAIYSGGGKEVIISPEGIEIKGGLTTLPKGTKVLSNDETAELIQTWYENRRD